MSASFSDSLAAEINSVSRTEVCWGKKSWTAFAVGFSLTSASLCFQLMEAIHKQEEINYRLQDYIDKIIVAIMESNPSILEVK